MIADSESQKIWDQAIDAAAEFVESHLVYPQSAKKIKRMMPQERERYRKHKPARVIYAEALRAELKGKYA